MREPVRVMPKHTVRDPEADPHFNEEWLVTNGLGGYASGTVRGAITRRYHGLLIAALATPRGRMMVCNALSERLRRADRHAVYAGSAELTGSSGEDTLAVSEFRLEAGLPVWRYETDQVVFEKRLIMPYRQNTIHVTYRLLRGKEVRLGIRPAVHFRPHDAPVSHTDNEKYVLTVCDDRYEISTGPDNPVLRWVMYGKAAAFTFDRKLTSDVFYRTESSRGYDSHGSLWSPGYFRIDLAERSQATLVASTEDWHTIGALTPEQAFESEIERRRILLSMAGPAAQEEPAAELVLAADQFLITPVGRPEDAARARATGDEIRTVIAGYHWFTDWGRDTMISLEGLTLTTGRKGEAAWILRTFAHYFRDGLIPNMFPEGEKDALYNTADATLWFFHALHRYVEITHDRTTMRLILPALVEAIHRHIQGTRFGIHVDPADGLLAQGEEGYQLTWMDAKVGDWVVTPRRGKAVEINALWYNALRLAERWVKEEGGTNAAELCDAAQRARDSFNARFWNANAGCLYDLIDGEKGDDPACRPNQIFAISLDYPVLDEQYWRPVLDVVTNRLLTPRGLRSLAPGERDYKARYYGDLRSRDAAYHQGTVWAWLIGPYIDAWLRVNPGDSAQARKFLEGFTKHLDEACIGSISEIFDAEEPYTPRGCIAQAWSVAEVLRAWLKTAGAG
ncbi:MAG TPA: amylo-alpha-1,6-glucosidase [Bryobacteraceae bacterium]|nr:amylo-alpha-1,6-glucosidase [Bryobacteraceae bacterium]